MLKFFQCLLPVLFLLLSCKNSSVNEDTGGQVRPDQIFQYSVFIGLANKMYDGNLTVGQLKENGDIGLGTFSGLNGELIMVDGDVFQLLSDGKIRQPADQELIPFATASFFVEDELLEPSGTMNFDQMKSFIGDHLPSRNYGYAIKIKGTFKSIKCGGATLQEKPYRMVLSDALVDRPVFSAENTTGTIVGFWIPEYYGKAYILGFHLHFISDDHRVAGHVMDFEASGLKIGMDVVREFKIVLPDTEAFRDSILDLTQGYSRPAKQP